MVAQGQLRGSCCVLSGHMWLFCYVCHRQHWPRHGGGDELANEVVLK